MATLLDSIVPTERAAQAEAGGTELDEDLIAERLLWTPKQRLDYLLDMLEFEERARRARIVPSPER